MFAPKLSDYQLMPDSRVLVFTDQTAAYSAENPGGYGGPNPVRESLALILLCRYMGIEEGTELITAEPYEPVIALGEQPQSFTLPWAKDGWFTVAALYFELRGSKDPDMFTEGQVVYDAEQHTLVRRVGMELTPVTAAEAEMDAVYTASCEDFAVLYNTYYKMELGEKCTNLLRHHYDEDDCHEYNRAIRHYNIHNISLATAVWTFCAGRKYEAQAVIEGLNKRLVL